MGYTITIGGVELDQYARQDAKECGWDIPEPMPSNLATLADEYGHLPQWLAVGTMRLPDAPTFEGDEITGNSNCRRPGYGVWMDFAHDTGLSDLFYAPGGIMEQSHTMTVLNAGHLAIVQESLALWRATFPNEIIGWGENATERGMDFARLIWLEWWMRWAIEHCSVPAIEYN